VITFKKVGQTDHLSTPSLGITSGRYFLVRPDGDTFNSLSRDHEPELDLPTLLRAEGFQLPLSGSHHMVNSIAHIAALAPTFNSLSRDHVVFSRAL
jgi:hypothetical protein